MIYKGGERIESSAHGSVITSLEMTKYNGTIVLFSGSHDFRLKAWSVDPQANTLQQVDMKDVGVAINCLQMANDEFLVAGTVTGDFVGWNLKLDATDKLPAHQNPITHVYRNQTVLISGDSLGGIQVRDSTSFALLFEANPA